MNTRSPTFPRTAIPALLWGLVLLLCIAVAPATANDTEGCLNCHRYSGLSRLSEDGKTLRQFHVEPAYFAAEGVGPHAAVRCTGCHDAEQVRVFPHQKVTPVDCARVCHLESRTSETRFSHASMRDALQASAHTQEVLEKANRLLASPLRPGQSVCLLCHEEQSLAGGTRSLADSRDALERCNACHAGPESPNPQVSFWHINGQLQPARSRAEVMAACVPCHSDPRVRAQFHLPDSVASYFWSFHGKAMLLGNQRTAACLDCHVRSRQNPHLILPRSNPQSSIQPAYVADACRAAACHPYADTTMASAAIHLDLPANRSIERIVAAGFVLLIVFTFGPSLLICVLKLIHGALAKPDPEEHHRAELARRIMQSPQGRQLLQRFSVAERLQHWLLATCFITLVVTGFPIKFADMDWARWMLDRIGGLDATRVLHRIAGVLLLAGLVLHLFYIASRLVAASRKQGRSLKAAILDLPLIPRPSDQKFMLELILYLLFLRRRAPQAHRFNPEQKFEYLGVFWGTIVLGCTGLAMWNNTWTASHLSGRVLTFAALIHTFEAFLALLHVGIVHIVGVIFSPQSFPVSRAMFTGLTPPAHLAETHAHLIEDVRRQLAAEHATPHRPHHRGLLKRIGLATYSFGMAGIAGYLGVSAFIYMTRTAFFSMPIPARISHWPAAVSPAALRDAAAAPGLGALADREPLGHYHHIEPWYRSDSANGCTVSGCHEPLPHTAKVKTAAFANAHAAFLTCEMCHPAPGATGPAGWISTRDGSAVQPPAAVRLQRFLEINQDKLARSPADLNDQLRRLVRELAAEQNAHPSLGEILQQLDAAQPASPVWRSALEQLRQDLPALGRGDRGAKLARAGYQQRAQAMLLQAQAYAGAAPSQQQQLKSAVHLGMAKQAVQCVACHCDANDAMAFDALGYAPSTAVDLRTLPLARLMDGVGQGQQFHIPALLKTEEGQDH